MKDEVGKGVSVIAKTDKKEMDEIIDRLAGIVRRLEEALAIDPEEKPLEEEGGLKRGSLVWAKIGGKEVACKVRRLKGKETIVKVKDKEDKNYGKKFRVPTDSLKEITK